MRFRPICLLFAVSLAANSEPPKHSGTVRVAGQQVTLKAIEQTVDQLMESYQQHIFGPEFKEHLRTQGTWQKQLAYAVLMRYPDGPNTGAPDGPGAYTFESQLGQAITMAPNELAPRVLMLAHCGESQLSTPAECFALHSGALLAYHPDNAVSYLYQAQGALERGDVTVAAEWMEKAGSQESVSFGLWAVVQVLFDVFGESELLEEDPFNLGAVARLQLAEGMLAHLSSAPHIQLNYPCQRAKDEPLLTGCLAMAQAMKLPGTLTMGHRIALAIEQNVYRKRGDKAALGRLKLEQQSLKIGDESRESIRRRMLETGEVAEVLNAWVQFGELDTQQDFAARPDVQHQTPAGGPTLKVLQPSHNSRLQCLAIRLPPGAPQCVTQDMITAESLRIAELLDQQMTADAFNQRLATDPNVDAQLLLLQRNYHSARRLDRSVQPPVTELKSRFPAEPVANRLAAQWCNQDTLCLQDVAGRLMTHEPDDAIGYLLSATAYLADGQDSAAMAVLDQLDNVSTYRGGYGLVAVSHANAIFRNTSPEPEDDSLGVWSVAANATGIGFAAAVSFPALKIYRRCEENVGPLRAGCLKAARAFRLPGASLLESLVSLKLEAELLHTTEDNLKLADIVDQLAALEDLRDAFAAISERITFDPTFSHKYMELLGHSGELAAQRWMLNQPSLLAQ